jgi:outer membrane receptor for ferrienterochelin and colicin
MYKLFLFLLLIQQGVIAQNAFKAYIRDEKSEQALPFVSLTIEKLSRMARADSSGYVELQNIPDGSHTILFSFTGYEEKRRIFKFPLTDTMPVIIYLESKSEALGEVVVTSTRSSRTIRNIPTRIELIAGEELDEKSNMFPSNITMLLRESTGIQVQQTSAVSGSSSFRLQGLPGRYTQLLKDGFPLYSGYASGFSLLQVPPLDLQQVEIIKGSASTLYGGGAIAGIVNLISKKPTTERETRFFLNGTSAGGFDANALYAEQFRKSGVLLYGTCNMQKAYDPASVNFSALPKQIRFNFNPRFYYTFDKAGNIMVGVNYSHDDRLGGSMKYVKGERDSVNAYFEKNISDRFATQLKWEKKFINDGLLTFKNTINTFSNTLTQPGYSFGGKQTGSYSELTYNINHDNNEWVAGTNVWTEQFSEHAASVGRLRDYALRTVGLFIQNTWNPSGWFTLETGIRTDYNHLDNPYYTAQESWQVLPRISGLFTINKHFTSRLGGGLGYKMPSIFNEEAEALFYKNVLTIDLDKVNPERSYGANFDIYYRGKIGDEISFNFNQLFFYTRLNKTLIFDPAKVSNDVYDYMNADGFTDTKGMESQVKLKWKDLVFFGGYTFQQTKRMYNSLNNAIPLTPKHRLMMTLFYEQEEKLKMGLETAYTGQQYLSSGRKVKDYWTVGFSAEKIWEHFSLYVNFENFTDTRQTRWEPFYTGSPANPHFAEIYAPTDGFIFNGGVKIRL